MVRTNAQCLDEGCSRTRTFAMEGSDRAEYCSRHALEGMVNVVNRRCRRSGCKRGPSYGVPRSKTPLFCARHAKKGMTNVVTIRCARDGCKKLPSYGVDAVRRLYCAAHAEKGMVSVRSRKCRGKDCKKHPEYGMPGAKRALFCVEHARRDMINLASQQGHGTKDDDSQKVLVSMGRKMCAHADCSKYPSYGLKGASPIYCAEHAPAEMVNVRCNSMLCRSEGCSTFASYGVKGTRKRLHCALHAPPEMINVNRKACGVAGCSRGACQNVARTRRGPRCALHALVDIVPGAGHGEGEGDRRMKSETATKDGSKEAQCAGQKRKKQAGAGGAGSRSSRQRSYPPYGYSGWERDFLRPTALATFSSLKSNSEPSSPSVPAAVLAMEGAGARDASAIPAAGSPSHWNGFSGGDDASGDFDWDETEEWAPTDQYQCDDVTGDGVSNNSGSKAELEGDGEEADEGSGNDDGAERGGETFMGDNGGEIESERGEEVAAANDAGGNPAISYELRIETLESALQESEQKRHEVMGRLELALEELSAERSKSSAILSALHDFTGVAGVHLAPSDAEEGRARSADGGLEVDFSGSGARANGSGSSSATGWNFRERAEGVGDSWRLASNFAMNSGGLSVPSAKDFIGNVPWSVCVPGGSAPATILK